MNQPTKSTVEEIRKRFDADVERFSNLETGQSASIDAPLAMELITQAAVHSTSPIERILDVGCGAGNNALKLREVLGRDMEITLLDLSKPMVERAVERVSAVNNRKVDGIIADVREADLSEGAYDVILAAAVLHHLRDEEDWEQTFGKLYRLLRPGGSLWITDLITHDLPSIQKLMWERYGAYLEELNGPDYRKEVFDYIALEDSPRSLGYQMDLLKEVGFSRVEILHKNSVFAAFGAVK